MIGISGLYHYWTFSPNDDQPVPINEPMDHGYDSDATLPEDNPNWKMGAAGLPPVPGNKNPLFYFRNDKYFNALS